jgi:hypothetical protein
MIPQGVVRDAFRQPFGRAARRVGSPSKRSPAMDSGVRPASSPSTSVKAERRASAARAASFLVPDVFGPPINRRFPMDKLRIRLMCLVVIAGGGLGATARADIHLNFDTPVVTGPTASPGVWYTDRQAPALFDSPSLGGLLRESIAAADVNLSDNFYNTQGRTLDLDPWTHSMDIQLYVPSAWNGTGGAADHRFAGFWGVGVDSSNTVSAYPIIEFANVGGTGEFRLYDSNTGVWSNLGALSGYDQFHTLSVSLQGSNFVYSIDGNNVGSYDSNGTVALKSVILQGYNSSIYGTPQGTNYTIYWDNFNAYNTTAAVPEPASIVSAVVGLAGMGLVALRRSRKAVA